MKSTKGQGKTGDDKKKKRSSVRTVHLYELPPILVEEDEDADGLDDERGSWD